MANISLVFGQSIRQKFATSSKMGLLKQLPYIFACFSMNLIIKVLKKQEILDLW